jgi:hypothetical protein
MATTTASKANPASKSPKASERAGIDHTAHWAAGHRSAAFTTYVGRTPRAGPGRGRQPGKEVDAVAARLRRAADGRTEILRYVQQRATGGSRARRPLRTV